MIRTLYRSSKGGYTTDVPPTHWRVALRDEGGLLWVDFCDEKPEKLEPLLRDVFKFHALAIEDALRFHKQKPLSRHLEVETYTWDMLPDSLKSSDIVDYIYRELDWVRSQLV